MATRRVTVQLRGDDDQLKRVLDEVQARLKLLDDKTVKIKVKTDSNTGSSLFGSIGRLLFGQRGGDGSSMLSKLQGMLKTIPGIGSALSSLAGSGGLAGLTALAAAVVALVGYISSIIPELVAAGIGVGAFAALAIPTFSKITAAIAGTKGAMKGLDPEQRKVVSGAKALETQWKKMAQAFAPSLIPIMKTLESIAHKLLPDLLPFAQRAAFAIEKLLKQFDRFASSAGFKSFMNEMLKLSGPAITAIGQGIGQVAASLGVFLKDLASPNGLLALKYGFAGIAGAIRLIGFALKEGVRFGGDFAQGITYAMHGALVAVKFTVDAIMNAIGVVFHALASIPGPQQHFFQSQLAGWQNWQHNVDSVFNAAISKVNDWTTAVKNAPKIVALQANIQNLESRLAVAKQKLQDPNLTKTRRAQIEANISNLESQLGRAKMMLEALQGYVVYTYVNTAVSSGGFGGTSGPRPHHGSSGPHGATTLGSAARLRAPSPQMTSAAAGMAAPAATPSATVVGGAQININFNGMVTDPTATAKAVQTMLLDLKRRRGNAALGLA